MAIENEWGSSPPISSRGSFSPEENQRLAEMQEPVEKQPDVQDRQSPVASDHTGPVDEVEGS